MRFALSALLSLLWLLPGASWAAEEAASEAAAEAQEAKPTAPAEAPEAKPAAPAEPAPQAQPQVQPAAEKSEPKAAATVPAAAPKRVAIVVTPLDPGAAEAATLLEQALLKDFAADGRLAPVDLLPILGGQPEIPPPSAEVEEHFKKGKDAYDNLDLAGASKEYLEGLRLLLEDPVSISPTVVARALTWAGASHLLNGENEKAAAAFRRASLIGPDYAPDANEFSPDILAAYADAKKAALEGDKGTLKVLSNVAPSVVAIDGSDRGLAPLTLELPAGRHHVVVKSRAQLPWGAFVEVQPGGTATASAELTALPRADRYRRGLDLANAEMGEKRPGLGVNEVGSLVDARYLVLGVARSGATAGTAVELAAWDLDGKRRAVGLKKTLLPTSPTFAQDASAIAALLADGLIKPQAAEEPSLPIVQRPWFWPVVGGVGAILVGGAVTGIVLAASGPNRAPTIITTGIP